MKDERIVQELSRNGRKRRLTSAMTDMLQGNSNHTPESSDDPPYEQRTPTKASPQRARAPSKRTHAQKATRLLLAAQLQAKCSALRDQQPLGAAQTALDQQAESLMSGSPDEWHPSRRLPHVGSSTTLSPSVSTSLSRFGSSDFCMSPGAQLASPIGSGLSSNSTTTNLGLSYASPLQGMPWRPCQDSPASAPPHWGPSPMLGHDWLPQHPSLAAQLSQIRTERQRPGVVPVDVLEGMWGFDEFLPEPGAFERHLDDFGPSLDLSARASHGVQLQHGEAAGHSLPWPMHSPLVATSNAAPGAISSGVAHFLGMA
ncbi:hypothetical protein ABBQ32_014037 [Trebouxia sp. C0010 RCD-2024]